MKGIPGTRDAVAEYCNGSRTIIHIKDTGETIGVDGLTFEECHPCDSIRHKVDEDWKDGSASNAIESEAIRFAKNQAKANARRAAKEREKNHTCPPRCEPKFEVEVDEPSGTPVVDPHVVDPTTTRYVATIAAHWTLYLTCRPEGG